MKNNRHLVFAISQDLDARNAQRFGMNYFQKQGYQVTVWNLTRLLFPNKAARNSYGGNELAYTDIATRQELAANLSKLAAANGVMICILTMNRNTVAFYSALSESKIPYTYSHCNVPGRESLFTTFFKDPEFVLRRLHSNLRDYLALRNLRAPAVVMYGGLKSKLNLAPFSAAKPLWAHAYDYDRYLEVEQTSEKSPIGHDYALYLDHGSPFHPDFFHHKKELTPERRPEVFYPSILKYLKMVEKQLGLPVVVAAHPRCDYSKIGNVFEGRKVLSLQTPELVKYAKIVVAHNSTSIAFPAIYRSPLIFIPSSVHPPAAINKTARLFGLNCLESESTDLRKSAVLTVDEARYQSYVTDYIKVAGTPGRPTWELLAAALAQI
jgi:hypothetical protein